MLPLTRHVVGLLVVVEACTGAPETAFEVAADYVRHLQQLAVKVEFLHALWFAGSPYEPGLLLRPGVFVSPRALGRYPATIDGAAVDITPWYFAKRF